MNAELAYWRWMAGLLGFGQIAYAAQAGSTIGMLAPVPVLLAAVASGIGWLGATLTAGIRARRQARH